MFKSRLSAWGFSKNSRDREYQICARLHKIRRLNGKSESQFIINGNRRSLRDLRKYIKGRKMTEDAFIVLAEESVPNDQLDDRNVRAITPPLEGETAEETELETPRDFAKTQHADPHEHEKAEQGALSTFNASNHMRQDIPHHQGSFSTQNESRTMPRPAPAGRPTSSHSAHSSSNSMAFSYQHSPRRRRRSSSCQYFDQQDVDMMAYQTVHCNSLPGTYGKDNLDAFKLLNRSYSSDSNMSDYNIICPKCKELVSAHYRSLSRFNDTSGSSIYLPSPSSSQSISSPRSPTIGNASGPRSILHTSPDLPKSAPALSIPTSSKEHDHSWKWVSRCYLACIHLSHHTSNPIRHPEAERLAEESLRQASVELEAMCTQDDEKLILTLNQTLMVLHQHEQGDIVRRIMTAAHEVVQRCLGSRHPAEILTKMMVLASDPDDLKEHGAEHGITSEKVGSAWQAYVEILDKGEQDPRALGAMYSYGFMLNVESEKEGVLDHVKLALGEQTLRRCYELSCQRLGKRHLQSIQCLIALRINLERQKRMDEAIAVAERVLDDSLDTLGKSHPRRLETMRNLAVTLLARYEEKDDYSDIERAEELYWYVLQGRVRMLGRDHKWTSQMKEDYIALLKWDEKWREVDEGPCKEREAVEELFDWDMLDSESEDEAHAGAF